MRLALALFGLSLLSLSCSPASSTSCASSCIGCCDAKGVCQPGSGNLECGAAGATCTSCMLGANCLFGVCQAANTSGGGNGSTGGGAATGGGNGSTGGGAATGGGNGSTGGGSATGGGAATGGGSGSTLIPNVMLLIDTSGSMSLPNNPAAAGCPANCGSTGMPCPVDCPTRISTLRAAMSSWLSTRGGTLRLGLTTYPTGPLCQSSATPSVNLPAASASDVGTSAALQQNAATVNTTLQGVVPQGGTPTGDALRGLASLPGLGAADGRADYVVLITDGLPNCNMSNPNALCACGASCTTTQVSACNCTTSACTGSLCSLGCLDSMGAVSAVTQLQSAGIKTVVIGFGADVAAAPTAAVLDAMARAGGAPRLCGGTPCAQASYSAATTTELQTVLTSLLF